MKAVAREVELELQHPLSLDVMGDLVEKLLLTLADDFNIKGIVPGHLKALVMEDQRYAAFSCTKPGTVTRQKTDHRDSSTVRKPRGVTDLTITRTEMEQAGGEQAYIRKTDDKQGCGQQVSDQQTRDMQSRRVDAFFRPRLLLNAVIVGIPEEKVKDRVDQRVEELLVGIQ